LEYAAKLRIKTVHSYGKREADKHPIRYETLN